MRRRPFRRGRSESPGGQGLSPSPFTIDGFDAALGPFSLPLARRIRREAPSAAPTVLQPTSRPPSRWYYNSSPHFCV